MRGTSTHYPKGKMQGLVFQRFKKLRVHIQVLRLSVEFLDTRQRGEPRRSQRVEVIVNGLVDASDRHMGSIATPDSTLEGFIAAGKITGIVSLKIEWGLLRSPRIELDHKRH